MTATADDIAALVQKHYDALPAKRKPVIRDNGLREWVPLAGIVAEGKDGKLSCLALATGMKCLPASKLPQAQGNVLHDWHAEVLAIRAFNRFVLDECKAVLQGRSSEFLRRRTPDEIAADTKGQEGDGGIWHDQPFAWKEGLVLHMYCSEAPCGDASMELIMAEQEDATPWDVPSTATITTPNIPLTEVEPTLPGRAYFSQLGVVRRKPARSDAQPTLSKSCSDKLALKQCTSLLSSPAALLIDPRNVYLSTLVMPASRYSESACRRAFSAAEGGGRMRCLVGLDEKGGYAFQPFIVQITSSEFRFSQRSVMSALVDTTDNIIQSDEQQPKVAAGTAPSNLSVAWTRSGREETTLGGTLQGRKQFDPRGASFASRRKTWALVAEVIQLLEQAEREAEEEREKDKETASHPATGKIKETLNADTYSEMKTCTLLGPRRRAKEEARKEALKGWIRNTGDESFTL